MKLCWSLALFATAVLGLGQAANAAPIASVDLDPLTPGVQEFGFALTGTSFEVDIVISGVDAGAPLNGFELDLDFDPAILAAISVVDGGFLLGPVFVVHESVGSLSVEFAEVTLGSVGATGSGVLATIGFQAIGTGSSLLDLNDLILAAPFGLPIPTAAVNDGTIAAAPIPEPSAAILFVVGGLIVSHTVRTRRGGRRS